MAQQTQYLETGNTNFPIVIIGSGFAGIGMGIKLKQANIHSFIIYEREGEVGWYLAR